MKVYWAEEDAKKHASEEELAARYMKKPNFSGDVATERQAKVEPTSMNYDDMET